MSSQPPFAALRILEAASRHRSYTWAAKELNVTHSAISQSIRRLEETLGTTLFERRGGAMEPSQAALKLAQGYSQAASALEHAILEVRGGGEATTLSVNMPASLGSGWFVSKLSRLADAAPDLNVEISTTPGTAADLQFAYASTPPAGSMVLSPITLFPVRAPASGRRRPTGTTAPVGAAPLLVEAGSAWRVWARRFPDVAGRGPPATFDDATVLMEAAAQGGGVALAHPFIAEAHLESGRLEALPFPASTGLSLTLQSAKPAGRADAVDRLVQWIRQEVALTQGRQEAWLAGAEV
jgi:DNA-binding transcriptional LysR family regulator